MHTQMERALCNCENKLDLFQINEKCASIINVYALLGLCVYVDVCSDREGHSGLEGEDRAPPCPDGNLTGSHDMHGRCASY